MSGSGPGAGVAVRIAGADPAVFAAFSNLLSLTSQDFLEISIASLEGRILEILSKAGPGGIVQADLVRILGVSKGWVSEALSRMEARGLVIRQRGPGKSLLVKLPRYSSPALGRVISIGMVPSTEYLALPLAIKHLEARGFRAETTIYKSVSEAASGLIRGEVHAAFLPIYMIPVLKLLGLGLIILGATGLGGASLVTRGSREEGRRLATSPFSSMEVLAHAYAETAGSDHEIFYYRSPEHALELVSRDPQARVVIWEPYATFASLSGAKKNPLSDVLGDYHCCVLVARKDLGDEVARAVGEAHKRATEDLRAGFERAVSMLSKITGIEASVIERSSKEYLFTSTVDIKIVFRILSKVRGFATSPSVIESLEPLEAG